MKTRQKKEVIPVNLGSSEEYWRHAVPTPQAKGNNDKQTKFG